MPRARLTSCLVALVMAGLMPTMAGAAESADTVTGPARAVGPDIIAIGDQRVILLGIDAPEPDQTCRDGENAWKCGDTAFAVLSQILNEGPVTCTLIGRPDPFRRRGGVCTIGGKDVAGEMVAKGLALAYSHDPRSADYLDAEKAARAAGVGLWKKGVVFQKPWEYRRTRHPGGFK